MWFTVAGPDGGTYAEARRNMRDLRRNLQLAIREIATWPHAVIVSRVQLVPDLALHGNAVPCRARNCPGAVLGRRPGSVGRGSPRVRRLCAPDPSREGAGSGHPCSGARVDYSGWAAVDIAIRCGARPRRTDSPRALRAATPPTQWRATAPRPTPGRRRPRQRCSREARSPLRTCPRPR